MLFRKKIARSCSYCARGTNLEDDLYLCQKRGLIQCKKSCSKFKYDPCKRVPPKEKAPDFSKYTELDYTL